MLMSMDWDDANAPAILLKMLLMLLEMFQQDEPKQLILLMFVMLVMPQLRLMLHRCPSRCLM